MRAFFSFVANLNCISCIIENAHQALHACYACDRCFAQDLSCNQRIYISLYMYYNYSQQYYYYCMLSWSVVEKIRVHHVSLYVELCGCLQDVTESSNTNAAVYVGANVHLRIYVYICTANTVLYNCNNTYTKHAWCTKVGTLTGYSWAQGVSACALGGGRRVLPYREVVAKSRLATDSKYSCRSLTLKRSAMFESW